MISKIILCLGILSGLAFSTPKDSGINSKYEFANTKQEKIPKTVIIKTKKFKVRIDRQPNGNYLYQSWGANTKITAKPSMIISNGDLNRDGSGGNYYFEFNNNGTVYQVWRNYLSDSAKKAPYTLVVIDESGKTLLSQDAQIVKN